jgi:multisubunit Na+/H+ antiporter MnhB subunit
MESSIAYHVAADVVLLLHALFAGFVVFGLVLIFTGAALGWSWVRNPWFRLVHLLAIAIVVIQSWLSLICPLTTFEMALRSRAGEPTYAGSFLTHWLETILYYQAPPWVFVVCYSAFGVLVVASWFWVRPRRWP